MKHAFLILAHNEWSILQKLLQQIDHKDVDIFLHIDKKSKYSFDHYQFEPMKYSKIYLIESQNIYWGSVSIVECEILLFKIALKTGDYIRFHLCSGQDLLIKPIEKLLEFCNNRPSEEFITINESKEFQKRIKYYHILVKYCRKSPIANIVRKGFIAMQIIFKVNRLKKYGIKFYYGSEWVSLTRRAVISIVNEYPKYKALFTNSSCPDESYKQMLLSKIGGFKFSTEGNIRYIDFGSRRQKSPKSLTIKDLPNIKSSSSFIARKFCAEDSNGLIKSLDI